MGCVSRGGYRAVWDRARLADISPRVFDAGWWRARGAIRGDAPGRGPAYFLAGLDGTAWVLRHARRGGALAALNHDRYLWLGATRARPLAEFHLLWRLRVLALPVPAPVAAQTLRRGLIYRGDLITQRIRGARPLAKRLAEAPLPAGAWPRLGAVLARFHRAGVAHADLNSRNVLVDGDDDFYVIDFDAARIRRAGRWRQANLARLRRSLVGFGHADAGLYFNDHDWRALRCGYHAPSAAGR